MCHSGLFILLIGRWAEWKPIGALIQSQRPVVPEIIHFKPTPPELEQSSVFDLLKRKYSSVCLKF